MKKNNHHQHPVPKEKRPSDGRGTAPASQTALLTSPLRQGLVPLKDGELSISVRVRGDEDALRWFETLEAVERGELVRRAYEARHGQADG